MRYAAVRTYILSEREKWENDNDMVLLARRLWSDISVLNFDYPHDMTEEIITFSNQLYNFKATNP